MSDAFQLPLSMGPDAMPRQSAPAALRPASPLIDRRRRTPVGDGPAAAAVEKEFDRQRSLICARIDRRFAWLMLLQWAACIATALWVSPLSWAGDNSYLHPHVSLAIFYGGVLTLAPVCLAWIAAGQRTTRLVIAVSQMLMSSLLIHLTGGRIETHFHIFGSLAFLAFYLDWQVLIVASATIAIDHFLRGMFLPYSIFGSYTVYPWRWLEHAGWVIFSDVFLLIACNDRMRDLRALTTRHVEREELLHHALYDSLTGLPNRSFLSDRMSEAIQKSKTSNLPSSSSSETDNGFCCIYIDLDHFKEVNDQLGHIAGDELLLQVAKRMQSNLSDDAFLARLGGDEFIAMVPQLSSNPNRVEEIARSILRVLQQPFAYQGAEVIVGVSIGISRYPQDGQDAADLLSKSDRAMYKVKRSGRNGFLYHSPEMLAESEARDEAERQLRRAIDEKEFRLQYQPICHADSSIAGFEALLRWTDPVRGPIPPSEFIPLAEEAGMVSELGSFVLHEACKQATDWHSRGLFTGRIAVNVSSLELARSDYADAVMLTLRQHYTPPEVIELEVTETALVNDFALAERHLHELHRHGILISIDDFGTGYSSLGRLRQLTLDTLKIDRCFIERVATSDADRTVVGHIIAMAHTLGLKVVAEGVETEVQLEALRSLGCDQIQGYLLGRPMNLDCAEALLAQNSPEAALSFRPDAGSEGHSAGLLREGA